MVAADNFYSDEEPLSKYSPVTLHRSTATYYSKSLKKPLLRQKDNYIPQVR